MTDRGRKVREGTPLEPGKASSEKPLEVAIVAGEPSGDRQGAALLRMLRDFAAPRAVTAWGIGGRMLRDEGVSLRYNSEPWASIGLASTLVNLPVLLSALADMKRALKRRPPDVLVLIDAGGFNMPLARWAKRNRICPVFYYFPPGSWRRGGRTGRNGLADATDRVVTPFPWSADWLGKGGADAHFVGHPLLDLVHPELAADEFYARYGLDPQRPLIALLPGSRRLEIRYILPALIGAAGEISRRVQGVQFAIALAPSVSRSYVERLIRREQRRGGRAARLNLLMSQAGDKLAQINLPKPLTPPVPQWATNEGVPFTPPEMPPPSGTKPRPAPPTAPLVICENLTYDVIARSDLVITKSGTSTLETAILNKPMIIVYRVSKVMAVEYLLRRGKLNIAHIGLPNILAGERVFPELLQDDASPEGIAQLAVDMLFQPERLLHLKERLTEIVHTNLGEPGGVARAAALLFQTATGSLPARAADDYDD